MEIIGITGSFWDSSSFFGYFAIIVKRHINNKTITRKVIIISTGVNVI